MKKVGQPIDKSPTLHLPSGECPTTKVVGVCLEKHALGQTQHLLVMEMQVLLPPAINHLLLP